ncbi:folylpolyglutamate synthase, mitochondrial [Microplitis demolitor]|uniref:folylpolyglutamate synthase, mitochondrial n=1 Tax=Microplitis demolitor TaxID=69319 RepID=UPI0004CD4C26|nr:folylpolyglutamate synthase, mitochondrial [Microplitis demolitor]
MNCVRLLNTFKKMVMTSQYCTANYQSAIEALNNLQSNAAYLRTASRYDVGNTTLKETEKYLLRSGLTLEDLKKLSVIHVAGTKGKGSTCAFTESILRHHGYKTGLYTSPHLISVRERIRINGQSISEEIFTEEFWRLHNSLSSQKDHEADMPPYFRFLTILMFHVFLRASVDVAIVEVGIGGLYDCTNIIPQPVCVGITRLDLDHTALLGDTLPLIAAQKAGIFKKNVPAFSVTQPSETIQILRGKASAICCPLNFVSAISCHEFKKNPPELGVSSEVQYSNAALAIELSRTWLSNRQNSINNSVIDYDKVETGLKLCKWPGRTQILKTKSLDFYLDGAHTQESMNCCVEWFSKKKSVGKKSVLIFNATGNRDAKSLLEILGRVQFSGAYFVPNFSGIFLKEMENRVLPVPEQAKRCQINYEHWVVNNNNKGACANSVKEALEMIESEFKAEQVQVLITGSLHLIGAALALLDPELKMHSD